MNIKTKLAGVALVAASVFAGTQLASADVPAADGTITGCQNDITGLVRFVDAEASESCGIGETEVTWTDEGLDGYEVVDDFGGYYNSTYHYMEAICPQGKVAVGGGVTAEAQNGTDTPNVLANGKVTASYPKPWSGDPTRSAWRAEMSLPSPAVNRGITVYAICVNE